MKKLFTLLLIANLITINSSIAQTAPVAVNDTVWSVFDTQISITRTFIVSNDTTKGGGLLKVDTIFYNGSGVVSNVSKNALGINSFKYTPPVGFFGLDSVTYYLTNYPTNYGYDTAIIYINVKRKAFENIDLNNINARIDKEVLFMDRNNSVAAFEVPKGSGSTTIFAANLWFAGLNSSSQLRGYVETFGLTDVNNAGPIGVDSNYSYQWDRVWKVSTLDIQSHINGNGTTEAILNWPAHGDVSKGQAQNLAPFVDYNGDNYYNPLDGDYPLIKGQQAIYFIRNSDRTLLSGFEKSELEFHGMVYAYDCPEDSAINHTVFVDYTIYNRSTSTLTDCYFGQWVDLDVGNAVDDYIGCDVSRGTFYGYNGDNFDGDANGANGYGASPPFQGVTFLKGAKLDDDGNDNPLTTDVPTALAQNGMPYAGLGTGFGDGTIDNEYVGLSHFMTYNIGSPLNGNGDPSFLQDYYYYLKGKWLDGSPVLYNGLASNYMFTGNSDPLHWSTAGIDPMMEWSEVATSNTPGDRRGVGSTGPFTFYPGEVLEMELAFVFGRDYNGTDNVSSFSVMQERVDSIRSYHANGFATTPCGGAILGTKPNLTQQSVLTIYPNPFNSQFILTYQPTSSAVVEVFNLLGNKVVNQNFTQKNTVLDLANQPNGIYLVKVTDGSKVLIKKVVKQ
ncbi:MAG: T9SS type A sorting domain-containing protein [Flavobacteriales bacterium]|nr:T9SS type A sorting domain-containing protein [Flavobacteriales bacterium]MCL4856528.1 T9SS type A sorting domain-containing protein [Flavobacteriales bacterium]